MRNFFVLFCCLLVALDVHDVNGGRPPIGLTSPHGPPGPLSTEGMPGSGPMVEPPSSSSMDKEAEDAMPKEGGTVNEANPCADEESPVCGYGICIPKGIDYECKCTDGYTFDEGRKTCVGATDTDIMIEPPTQPTDKEAEDAMPPVDESKPPVMKGDCPDGSHRVNCFVNPCDADTRGCVQHPDAECRPNYCGGCKAEYYIGGEKVDCRPCNLRVCPRHLNQMCDKNLRIHSNLCQFKVAKCEDPTLELLEDQSKCPIDVLPDWGTDLEDNDDNDDGDGDDDDDDDEEEGGPIVQPPDVQPPDIPTQKEVEEDNDAAKPSKESDDDAAPTDEDTAAPVEVEVEATDG